MKGKEVIDWIKQGNLEDEDLHIGIQDDRPCGMFECFHCLHRSVIWQSDFTFEDYGYEGEGIVQNLICSNCGAEIEYRVPIESEEEETVDRTGEDTAVCNTEP